MEEPMHIYQMIFQFKLLLLFLLKIKFNEFYLAYIFSCIFKKNDFSLNSLLFFQIV